MKPSTQKVLTVILAILSFPFFTAALINGKDTITLEKEPELEDFLASVVLMEIPQGYPEEAVKAQAVLVRSRCYVLMEEGKEKGAVVQELMKGIQDCEKSGNAQISVCEQAVRETEGVVLNYGGKTVEGPFFMVSNGLTRSWEDAFGNQDRPWLVQIESPWDIDAKEYLSGVFFTLEEMKKKLGEYGTFVTEEMTPEEAEACIKIETADQAGYVTELLLGDVRAAGETVRDLLGLPSSCFSVQAVDEKLRFLCKGVGHGFGLSQSGAAALAKEGKKWQEILAYYFPDLTLEKRSFSK